MAVVKKSNSKGGKALGLTAAAIALAAGAYFLYGKGAKGRRDQVKSWALKMKGEILEQVENIKSIDKETYDQVVDTVAKKYKSIAGKGGKEVESLVKELKSHWAAIQKRATNKKAKK